MTGQILPIHPDATDAHPLADLLERAESLIRGTVPANTLAAYSRQWRAFWAWAEAHHVQAMPAEGTTVLAYLQHLHEIGRGISTLDQARAAIASAHLEMEQPDPTRDARILKWREGHKTDRAREGKNRVSKAVALATPAVCALLDAIDPADEWAPMHRAMIALHYASAMRGSELLSLDLAQIERGHTCWRVYLGATKGDQTGSNPPIVIPREGSEWLEKHDRLLSAWLEQRGDVPGYLFPGNPRRGARYWNHFSRSSYDRLLKHLGAKAGLGVISAHSLRRGHASQAHANGADPLTIQRQTRHADLRTTAGYVAPIRDERENSARYL